MSAQVTSRQRSKQCWGKNQELENLIPKAGEKASRRWYPVLMILMCIELVLRASTSFRATPKAIHIVLSRFVAVKNQAIPTYKSIRRWLTQVGLYKLHSAKQQANDWALIVDHSVQIGACKLLVILGTRMSKSSGRPLTFKDVEPLVMEIHEKPNAQSINKILEKAQQKVGKVVMVCADNGPDLRGGLNLFCNKHHVGRVFDITHKIGTFLKRCLEKDPQWRAFTSTAAEAKIKMQQTQAAHLAAPK